MSVKILASDARQLIEQKLEEWRAYLKQIHEMRETIKSLEKQNPLAFQKMICHQNDLIQKSP